MEVQVFVDTRKHRAPWVYLRSSPGETRRLYGRRGRLPLRAKPVRNGVPCRTAAVV